jgi:mono/diheme cytochrome c family protein
MRAFANPKTCAVALALALSPFAAQAQSAAHFSPAYRFTEQSGEQLFANVCQGCHMPDARALSAPESIRRSQPTRISKPAAIRFTLWCEASVRCLRWAP